MSTDTPSPIRRSRSRLPSRETLDGCRCPRTVTLALGVLLVVTACGTSRRTTPAASSPTTTAPTATTSSASVSSSVAASTSAGLPAAALIDHVLWTKNSQGAQLQVFPTAAGRAAPADDSDRAWAEVLADAPTAGTAGMHDQFQCHWTFARLIAPTKPSWDLEPWRPAVGYAATVAASCNPGGPDE